MALSSVSIEAYTWILRVSQLRGKDRNVKTVYISDLEEVLRMHGVRSGTVYRTKVQMLEALDGVEMVSPFRSTLGSSDITAAVIDAEADLRALTWDDGEILEVETLEAAQG